ncbi:hypothetical protein OTK51_07860 [Vibrio scophthalmi]|uniref:hypothetical protein n=1 Tax=Vibrio scophthalmi TaxID=45658 RepID=UPI0022843884|nr:hypothetical protein [Vibrio scophthalmi]MCY9803347.1 hypothetical protein [Vibrio scophthalmi]
MNIKQNICLLLALIGVSFSAFSQELYQVTEYPISAYEVPNAGIQVGNVGTAASFAATLQGQAVFRLGVRKGTVSRVETFHDGARVTFCSGKYCVKPIVYWSKVQSCPEGQILNPETGACEEPAGKCADTVDVHTGNVYFPIGTSLVNSVCRDECRYALKSPAFWVDGSPSDPRPSGLYFGTGEKCTPQDIPEPPQTPNPEPEPDPEEEHKPTDPTKPIPDPSPFPDGSASIIPPDKTPDEPDVETPTPTPDSNGDIVGAVTGLNADLNSAINKLHTSINKGAAITEGKLTDLNTNVTDNTKAIKEFHEANNIIGQNTEDLLLGMNGDITTAVNRTTGAVKGLGKDLEGISDKLDKLTGNGATFKKPTDGTWNGTILGESIATLESEIVTAKEELSDLLTNSPLKLGQMDFKDGDYSGTTFTLTRPDWSVDVGFNLFTMLGVHLDLIRNVIIFVATLTAAYILLSSGREK